MGLWAMLCGGALLAQGVPASVQDNERAFAAAVERALARTPPLVDAAHPDRELRLEPRPGGTLRVQIESEPQSLNYLLHAQAEIGVIWEELHAYLARPHQTTLALEGELATSWHAEDRLFLRAKENEPARSMVGRLLSAWPAPADTRTIRWQSSDVEAKPVAIPLKDIDRVLRGSAITFELRRDALWHDEAPFDAEDVRFSYDCVRNPSVNAPGMSALFDIVEACEVLDRYRVRFLFTEQHFLAPKVAAALRILPRHLYERVGATAAEQANVVHENKINQRFVGLGPYRFVSWDRGERITLERNKKFFGAPGYPDRIVFRVISTRGAGLRELLAGHLDLAVGLSGSEYTNQAQGEEFEAHFVKDFVLAHRYTFIAWNLRREPGSSLALRRALAHSFDVEGFSRVIGSGFGARITGHASMLGPAYDSTLVPFPFDLERARTLLEREGWVDRDQDGWLDREGAPLRIGFLCVAGTAPAVYIGPSWKERLREIGVDLVLDAVDAQRYSKRVDDRDFDALCMDWVTPGEVDYYPVWHGRFAAEPGSLNIAGYANPKIDALIEEARTTLHDEERHALWKLVQRGIYEDQPYLFLYRGATRMAWSRAWRGVTLYPERPNWRLREWFFVK